MGQRSESIRPRRAVGTGVSPWPLGSSLPAAREVNVKNTLQAGVSGTAKIEVDGERTIDFMGEKARVYATPMLVRDIEIACRELMGKHLDPGEDSVGTRVEIDHLAATLLGMKVEFELRIAEVKGRAVTFEVNARDDVEPICRGRHGRFVVDIATTEKRLAAKAQKAGLK
jgi:fluoroacetyl-CoA thioesterase